MPNKYPEHSDQVDDFYRSQLDDHEIAPPDDLWDKIAAASFEKEEDVRVVPFFSRSQKVIGIAILVLLLLIGSYVLFSTTQASNELENNTTPAMEEKQEKIQPSNSSPDENTSVDPRLQTPAVKKTLKNNPSSTTDNGFNPSNDEQLQQPTNKELKEEVTVPLNTSKQDSVATENKTVEKPKEKIKFKDKYKKEYQDSTRKLFVPGK